MLQLAISAYTYWHTARRLLGSPQFLKLLSQKVRQWVKEVC